MKKNKVLFISSTGGHLSELLQLKPLFEKYDYHIITEKDKTNEYLKEKYEDRIDYLDISKDKKKKLTEMCEEIKKETDENVREYLFNLLQKEID